MDEESGISKVEANYKVAGEGEPPCSSCGNFISPDACKLVSGTISDKGTCDLYTVPEDQDLESVLFGGQGG